MTKVKLKNGKGKSNIVKPNVSGSYIDSNASINRVGKVCKDIIKLTENDFACVEKMAKEQQEYIHPLKYAKANKLNNTGDNNMKVIMALKTLQKLILAGKP